VAYGIAGPPAPSSQPLHGYPSAPAESQPTKRLGKVEVSTKRLGICPLVNVYITMERSTIFFNGKINSFDWAMVSIGNCNSHYQAG